MQKLQKILVKAKRQVFSEMVGNNPSVFHGEGYDFVELREYETTDDIRHIDWNITAKMQRPFVKVFREERELNVAVVSLLGGSIYFGSKRFKQEVVAEVNAMIGYSVLKNGDTLSSYICTDGVDFFLKPSKNTYAVEKSTGSILAFDPIAKQVNMQNVAKVLYKSIKRRSLIVVVGDFFELPSFLLLAKKHEVIAVVVRDRLEENPPVMGFNSFVDPQTSEVIQGDFNATAVAQYAKRVQEHDRELFARFKKEHIRFTKIYTDSNVGVALRRLFEARK